MTHAETRFEICREHHHFGRPGYVARLLAASGTPEQLDEDLARQRYFEEPTDLVDFALSLGVDGVFARTDEATDSPPPSLDVPGLIRRLAMEMPSRERLSLVTNDLTIDELRTRLSKWDSRPKWILRVADGGTSNWLATLELEGEGTGLDAITWRLPAKDAKGLSDLIQVLEPVEMLWTRPGRTSILVHELPGSAPAVASQAHSLIEQAGTVTFTMRRSTRAALVARLKAFYGEAALVPENRP